MGSVLCNACGLFLKLHGRPRPISLKTDVIKSRNRVKTSMRPDMMKKKVGDFFFLSLFFFFVFFVSRTQPLRIALVDLIVVSILFLSFLSSLSFIANLSDKSRP